ncbi:hypothetical protein RI543_005074 [Arxiozyma heterogenica]|uniref:Uncharacterized protein n=1 Tax=Arxiozyma heterogenica TaxID=278026 RepID=A0AAN8A5Y5_9SACH|nr:hypothetical protein RI543_005074 [Kazachstania heterogenica]
MGKTNRWEIFNKSEIQLTNKLTHISIKYSYHNSPKFPVLFLISDLVRVVNWSSKELTIFVKCTHYVELNNPTISEVVISLLESNVLE